MLVWLVGKLSSLFSTCRCCWGRPGIWCCGDLTHQRQHHHHHHHQRQQRQLQQDFHLKWHILTWVNWSSYPVTSWCKFWSFWVQKRLRNWVWFARVWDPLRLITDFGYTSFRPIRLNLLGILSSLLRPPWALATLFREYYRRSSFFTFSWIRFLCMMLVASEFTGLWLKLCFLMGGASEFGGLWLKICGLMGCVSSCCDGWGAWIGHWVLSVSLMDCVVIEIGVLCFSGWWCVRGSNFVLWRVACGFYGLCCWWLTFVFCRVVCQWFKFRSLVCLACEFDGLCCWWLKLCFGGCSKWLLFVLAMMVCVCYWCCVFCLIVCADTHLNFVLWRLVALVMIGGLSNGQSACLCCCVVCFVWRDVQVIFIWHF